MHSLYVPFLRDGKCERGNVSWFVCIRQAFAGVEVKEEVNDSLITNVEEKERARLCMIMRQREGW